MIDTPQRPTEAVEYKKELAEKGKVKYVINTEPHPDHFTGDYFFDAPLVAQAGTREAISKVAAPGLISRTGDMDPENRSLLDGYFIRLPEITFTDRMTIHLGKHTIEVLHLPGHTPSETSVYIPEEKVVFTGDNVVRETKAWMHESVPDKWLESLKAIEKLDIAVIVPGHGDDVCSRAYLAKQAEVINRWTTAVKSAIKAGCNEEQALARIGDPDLFPMPKGREGMTAMVNKLNTGHLFQLYKS